jgi:iron complex outermembrane receptor protein
VINKPYQSLRSIFLFLLISAFACTSYAQQLQDTLREVHIRDNTPKDTATDQRSKFTAGQNLVKIERRYKDLYETQSIANLLAQQSSVFIKSYGMNSIATLSLHGASAAQSSVLWNGVPVINPALGVADLSVLRTGLFSDVSVLYGSSAALFGSGNVGGAVMLDDGAPVFNNKNSATINAGYGSYGRIDGGVKVIVQHKRLRVGINGFYQRAKNNFNYTDANDVTRQMENARLEGAGGLLSLDYNLADKQMGLKHRIYLKVWLQQYDREIPPALFEEYSVKNQTDRSLRTLLGWEKNTIRSTFYAKAAYSKEYLHYRDSTVSMDNENTVHQYYQEIGWKFRLQHPGKAHNPERHLLLLFAPLQYAVASGQNISSDKTQFRPALVAAYRFEGIHRRLNVNAAVRQEWVNGNTAPLLPGLGASLRVIDRESTRKKKSFELLLYGNVQRTYRIPNLNELYYFPGGNVNLKPEQGWSQDGGYTINFGYGLLPEAVRDKMHGRHRFELTHSINVFNRNIQDWIYWLGGSIWTPHNIAGVHSRGLETSNKIELVLGEMKLHLGLNYTYVLSTTTESYLPGDSSIGKQIPYTPRYNFQGNLGLQWRDRLFVNYNQTYTGYRFVTTDESQYLKPYTTGNVQLSYNLYGKHQLVTISAQLQNVFNTQYEVVNARPMPGRNFLLQAKLGLF